MTNLIELPTPSEIVKVRKKYKLTQEKASELIFQTKNTWSRYESGLRQMHPAFWELFNIKAADLVKKHPQERQNKIDNQ